MSTHAGLWIDHRKAIVVNVTDRVEVIKLMMSAVEKQPRRAVGARHSGPFEAQKVPSDDRRERSRTGHLNIFYDQVIASVSAATEILIFGPGEAGGELKKRFDHDDRDDRIVAVEKVDKLSTNQIVARVRAHFAP
jgi:hypothetical protein